MSVTVDLPPEVLQRLEAEATRRGVTIDEVIAELAAGLPAESTERPKRLSFVGIGASTSGQSARDADEILGDGFGRS